MSNLQYSLCKKHLKLFGNTINLRKHLKKLHPIQFMASKTLFVSSSISSVKQNGKQPMRLRYGCMVLVVMKY